MTGLVRSTVSPSSSSISRSTPWVEGCCGPMLMIMVSSSDRSMSMSEGSTATPSGRRSTAPTSRRSSPASVSERPEQLLDALGGLGHQTRGSSPGAGARNSSPDDGGGSTVSGCGSGDSGAVAVGVRRHVAHRGPGASLNWTGTRPTP